MDPRKNNNLYSGGYQVDVTDGGPNGDFINPMDPGQPIQTDQNMNRTRGGYNYDGTRNPQQVLQDDGTVLAVVDPTTKHREFDAARQDQGMINR